MKMTGTILIWAGSAVAMVAAPKIIAHRGASHLAPENTLAAFRLAWKEGADGIEGDFHLTADGEIVCCHDFDTMRTTGVKRTIATTNWAELKNLDAGSWKSDEYRGETMPRLGDVLAEMPEDKWFFVEIKCGPEVLEPLASIFEQHQADPQRVFIISFNQEVVKEARKRLPEFQAHLVSSMKDADQPGGLQVIEESLANINATGFQFRYNSPVTVPWLLNLRDRGLLLASWTIDDPTHAARIAGMGVDFITTNRPAAIRRETIWPE